MHLIPLISLSSAVLVFAAVLEERQPFPCYRDRCLLAVNGTWRGPNHPITAQSDCRNYMTTTVVLAPILTTTTLTTASTLTIFPPCPSFPTDTSPPFHGTSVARLPTQDLVQARQETTGSVATTNGPVPVYAARRCSDATYSFEHYSSACRCIGITTGLITSTSITVTSTETSTSTDTKTAICSTSAPLHSTTSAPRTSTTYTITMSFNSTTSKTTVTMSDPHSGTESGTATGTESHSSVTSVYPTYKPSIPVSSVSSSTNSLTRPTPTPPYANTTASFSRTSTLTQPSSTLNTTSVVSSTTASSSTTSEISSTTSPLNTTSGLSSTSATIPITTPPFLNSTTSDLSSTSFLNTTFTLPSPTTSSLLPTNTTSSSEPTPTPPLCGGRGVQPCSGTCIDTSTDPQNCGACGNACTSGLLCTNGVCTRQQCDSSCTFSRLCGPSNETLTCACALDTGNNGICYNRLIDCADESLFRCTNNFECDVGSVCVPSACCDGGRCVKPGACGEQGGLSLGEGVKFGRAGSMVVNLGFA